jgi:hypothetical protein
MESFIIRSTDKVSPRVFIFKPDNTHHKFIKSIDLETMQGIEIIPKDNSEKDIDLKDCTILIMPENKGIDAKPLNVLSYCKYRVQKEITRSLTVFLKKAYDAHINILDEKALIERKKDALLSFKKRVSDKLGFSPIIDNTDPSNPPSGE